MGRPFFRMLFSVVSEKCNRPMDTRIGWGQGKSQDHHDDNDDSDHDGDDGDDDDDEDGDDIHLVSAESKLDREKSLPWSVSLALLNLPRICLLVSFQFSGSICQEFFTRQFSVFSHCQTGQVGVDTFDEAF